MTNKIKIPTVNWPQQSGKHKILQIKIDNKPILRFGDNEILKKLHSGILYELFLLIGIDDYLEIGSKTGLISIPAPLGARYQLYGAGKIDLDVENKKAVLFGNNEDYGIGIDKKHLDSIIRLEKNWKFSIK